MRRELIEMIKKNFHLGCNENIRICFDDFYQSYCSSSFVREQKRIFLCFLCIFFLSDSEPQIVHLAYQSLIELSEIWPNTWQSKETFDECIYSILSQDDKSDYTYSIRFFRTLLTHHEFEKESIRHYIQYLLYLISSDQFELLSVSNTVLIYKLLNDIFLIYPDIFSTKIIYHWSNGIFQDILCTNALKK
jgi:hypothetical protein